VHVNYSPIVLAMLAANDHRYTKADHLRAVAALRQNSVSDSDDDGHSVDERSAGLKRAWGCAAVGWTFGSLSMLALLWVVFQKDPSSHPLLGHEVPRAMLDAVEQPKDPNTHCFPVPRHIPLGLDPSRPVTSADVDKLLKKVQNKLRGMNIITTTQEQLTTVKLGDVPLSEMSGDSAAAAGDRRLHANTLGTAMQQAGLTTSPFPTTKTTLTTCFTLTAPDAGSLTPPPGLPPLKVPPGMPALPKIPSLASLAPPVADATASDLTTSGSTTMTTTSASGPVATTDSNDGTLAPSESAAFPTLGSR